MTEGSATSGDYGSGKGISNQGEEHNAANNNKNNNGSVRQKKEKKESGRGIARKKNCLDSFRISIFSENGGSSISAKVF